MKVKTRGILYHHFWGEYSAEVYLDFDTEWQAVIARLFLNIKTGLDWKQKNNSVGIHVNNEELDRVIDCLTVLGADRNKIASLNTSIDHGEPFTCIFEMEHPNQLALQI